ncbi:MAG: hypothetical protein ACM3UL_01425, partial [Ignavibacteria bacterium]
RSKPPAQITYIPESLLKFTKIDRQIGISKIRNIFFPQFQIALHNDSNDIFWVRIGSKNIQFKEEHYILIICQYFKVHHEEWQIYNCC